MNFFNITKQNDNLIRVKTQWNELEIHIDKDKGIGIYLMCDKGVLIKQYHHTNIKTAINYLLNNYSNFIN
jgi:hypothetical protein